MRRPRSSFALAVSILAGFLNRRQQDAIDYLREENSDRLQGALANLGHVVAPNTIKAILQRNGITPAPDRGRRTPWKTFLKTHAKTIFAADFFTTEVWTLHGLVTHYTFFVIHHASRAVQIVGTTEPWRITKVISRPSAITKDSRTS